MYFFLNNYCYLRPGVTGGTIYDLNSGNTITVDKDEVSILIKSESGNEIDEYIENNIILKELEKLNLGFFSPVKVYIDKLRYYNCNIAKRKDLNYISPLIAFLRLSNKCEGKCKICDNMFCPICTCKHGDNDVAMDYNKWIETIEQLCDMGVTDFIITGGDPCLCPYLEDLINYLNVKNAVISLVTVGLNDVLIKLPDNLNVIIPIYEERNYEQIMNRISHFNKIKILYSDNINYSDIEFLKNDKITLVSIKQNKEINSIEDLNPTDMCRYCFRRDFDICLLRKIFIDYQGNIVPCANALGQVISNIYKSSLKFALKEVITKVWDEPVTNEKCLNCDNYLACDSCKFFDSVKNCKYNIYSGNWAE